MNSINFVSKSPFYSWRMLSCHQFQDSVTPRRVGIAENDLQRLCREIVPFQIAYYTMKEYYTIMPVKTYNLSKMESVADDSPSAVFTIQGVHV